MTQAFNLAQLANNLNTSGQLDATDGLNGLVANANLASSGTASSTTYLRGDRTWASLPGLGKILQVVTNTTSTQATYSTASYQVITQLNTSITPSSTSSRILILLSMTIGVQANAYAFAKFTRNGSDISGALGSPTGSSPTAATFEMLINLGSGGLSQHAYNNNFHYVDSPSTTSSTTYSVAVKGQQTSTQTVYFNRAETPNGDANNIAGVSSITLLEIGA